MNLYIDTNIFLTFYHLTNDDLDELKKLAILIEDKQINLLLPEQTRNEFLRNRDKTINEAISSLKEQKLTSRYPQIAKGYEEYVLLQESFRNFEKHKNKIIAKIENDSREFKLNADTITTRIFKSSTKIETTSELINLAKIRYDLGNPPGKGKSYGDALNWEALMFAVESGEDLCIVSDDNDYISLLNRKELNLFLKDEWDKKKNSKIHFYKTISEFFKDKFPTITLSDELEKELIIKNLSEASTFISAKSRLAKLLDYKEFTNKQLNDIIEIAVTNTQLFWISTDIGVYDVLYKILEGNEDKIEANLLSQFKNIYKNIDEQLEDDELPF